MKYILPLLLVLITTSASADFYAQAGLGRSFNEGSVFKHDQKYNYKDSNTFSIAGGYEFPIPIINPRIEAEYLRLHPKVKEESTGKLNGLFVNAYADVPILPIVDPYVGLGTGITRFEHNNSIAVQGMAGIEYKIPFISTTIGGEYRYLKINETAGKLNESAKYHSNILMLKVRYEF